MSSKLRVLVAFLIVVWAQIARAEADLVGDVRDTDRIRFVGNKTFEAKLLQAALRYDADILIASHPKASRKEFLTLLQQRLVEGYQHRGFPEAQVAVRVDEDRSIIVATIQEGPRYRAGKVEVTGATTLPVDRFTDRFLNHSHKAVLSTQKSNRPWEPGQFASFSAGHWKSKRDEIQKTFQYLGYHDVVFSVNVRAEADQTATLVIAVSDEGPRAILGAIEVTGCQKNSEADVIRYLDLPEGTVLDADMQAQIEQKLANAARFLKHDVEIITPPFGDAPSTLRIKLVEYDQAPALTELFSAEEQTMIRLARWINQFGQTSDDFEAWADRRDLAPPDSPATKFHRGTIRLVMSPQDRACLFHIRLLDQDDHEVLEAWLHLTTRTIALDAPRQSMRFEAKGLSQHVIGDLSWMAQPPDSEGRMSNFKFGFGVRESDATLPPVTLRTRMAPVAALREAQNLKDSLKVRGDLLCADSAEHQLEIDRESGRLLRWETKNDTGVIGATFQPGCYRRLLAEYEQATSNSRVIVAGDYPVSNLMAFLANCIPDLKSADQPQTNARVALAHSLLKRGALHAFDSLLMDFFHQREDDFALPPLSGPSKAAMRVGWIGMLLPTAARLIVPNPSWPITICREYSFVLSDQGPVAERAIGELLQNRQSGPLENLLAAHVFGMIHPQLRIEFAKVGMTRLQRERFLWDCEPLLNPKAPIGKLMSAIGQTLQEIDVEEIESIVAEFPLSPGDQQALSHALRLVPAHKDDSPLDAIRVALDDAWEPLLEPYIRDLLNGLAH